MAGSSSQVEARLLLALRVGEGGVGVVLSEEAGSSGASKW